MKKNVGNLDRTLRVLLALVLILLTYFNMIPTPYSYISIVLSIVFIGTSFISFCPIYYGLGISSKPKEEK
jgi:hypothetical protein